jgi:hypothetical protein
MSKNNQLLSNSHTELNSIAEKMDMPLLSEKESRDINIQLSKLKPDEVLELKKLWRLNLVRKGKITDLESKSFPATEKAELIFSQRIREMYGDSATIFNVSFNDFAAVEKSLFNDSELTDLMRSIETSLATAASKSPQLAVTAASTCYYDNNWPAWLSETTKSGTMYQAGGSGRVKNDPNEWPCDFVLYIPANTYTKVTGSTTGMQCIVGWSHGLSASPSKDAVIVGYGRALACGSSVESWIKNEMRFKK